MEGYSFFSYLRNVDMERLPTYNVNEVVGFDPIAQDSRSTVGGIEKGGGHVLFR